jgi:predicted nucleic acid-binding Zn ribbon protein
VSGAAPDERDPLVFGAGLDRLVAERGWTTEVAVGAVLGRWSAVVGPDLAAHCEP